MHGQRCSEPTLTRVSGGGQGGWNAEENERKTGKEGRFFKMAESRRNFHSIL